VHDHSWGTRETTAAPRDVHLGNKHGAIKRREGEKMVDLIKRQEDERKRKWRDDNTATIAYKVSRF
jgi:hypothetical protein